MSARRRFSWLGRALVEVALVCPVAAQNATRAVQATQKIELRPKSPARKGVTFDEFVDSAIQQERRLTELMRNFKPVVETYIQQEKHDSDVQTSPKADDYFLSRLDLTGDAPANREFENAEHPRQEAEKIFSIRAPAFAPVGFAQAVFPDLNHFDRQNYTFEFVRWEVLGNVRCVVMNVNPRENSSNRGFVGRIWVEDQDYNIVRFTGTYTSKAYSKRSFHFDSWRLNTLGIMWVPAYVYTEESDPQDPSSHGLWFKAQTRIWGYDLQQAGDHHENTKPLTDNLDLAGIRCRVLLTTPLESFVVGRTIVVSRGLLDVLPDEATLAAVLSHELAHIVLRHSLGAENSPKFSLPFSDLEIFTKLDIHFDPVKEAEADKKGQELFSKSPYDNQMGTVALFLQALEARSPQLPNLLRARFSNDFGSSHLVGMQAVSKAPKRLRMDQPDQIAALPLGSRIKVDPWSDRIEMQKTKLPPLESAAEKRPFEVSPFFPYLKRLEQPKTVHAESSQ